jgi:hypothetical protein
MQWLFRLCGYHNRIATVIVVQWWSYLLSLLNNLAGLWGVVGRWQKICFDSWRPRGEKGIGTAGKWQYLSEVTICGWTRRVRMSTVGPRYHNVHDAGPRSLCLCDRKKKQETMAHFHLQQKQGLHWEEAEYLWCIVALDVWGLRAWLTPGLILPEPSPQYYQVLSIAHTQDPTSIYLSSMAKWILHY